MKWKKEFRLKVFMSMKELLPLILIGLSTIIAEKQITGLTVRKCCPKGQKLNSALKCVSVMLSKTNETHETQPFHPNNSIKFFFSNLNDTWKENNSTDEELFSWFPFIALIGSETLEKITDFKSTTDLFKQLNFKYGVRPECNLAEKEFGCFRQNQSEQFHLILYPDEEIKLYISKKSSYHDEGHFKLESRDCGFLEIDSRRRRRRKSESEMSQLLSFQDLRTFPSKDFCLDEGPNDSYLVEYCPCKTVPCVRKCCKDSEVFSKKTKKCIQNSDISNWRPNLTNSNLTENYYLLTNRYPLTCEKFRLAKLPEPNFRQKCKTHEDKTQFRFLANGSLQVKRFYKSVESYCGDHVVLDSNFFSENNALVCLKKRKSRNKFKLYAVLFISGGVLLLITVAVSMYLPELRTSVYNKVIISHNVCLMMGNFIWGTSFLLSQMSYKICVFLCLGMQCTFLGSFFWMNVMCYDIFCGLRSLKNTEEVISKNNKYLCYALYACGSPIIITSITTAIEFAPHLPNYIIRPGFGCHNCNFNPETNSILIYLYGPMLIIIGLNLLFYLSTIILIIKIQKDTAILQTAAKASSKKRLMIFSKLFLLVGLSWIMEIVSWWVGGNEYFWYLPDFVNISRAVFIFIIFTCKKKVFKSLVSKLKGYSREFHGRKTTITDCELSEVKKQKNED